MLYISMAKYKVWFNKSHVQFGHANNVVFWESVYINNFELIKINVHIVPNVVPSASDHFPVLEETVSKLQLGGIDLKEVN